MKRPVVRVISFVLILLIVLGTVNKIFKVKYGDGIYGLTKFYELEDNTVDVLILGSSHAFENFNTGVLWDEYGMASYVLAGAVQPLWNTYYYLKEALKTQRPELIILEGYMLSSSEQYSADSIIIKNNYGLKWSKNKIDSIKVSSPKERWREFLFEYVQYHTRYTEISSEDFLPDRGNTLYEDWKGFGCNMATKKLENFDITGIEDKEPLYEKTEIYYRKIIELAQENDIPLVIVVSPFEKITEEQQRRYNTAEEIASEYGVDFRNYNLCYREEGIDFMTDAADSSHLNYKGNQKFSRAVGQYLVENYNISDRREESAYQSWDNNAAYIQEQIHNCELTETDNLAGFVSQIKNKNYTFFISVDGYCNSSNKDIFPIMDTFQISRDGHRGIWYANLDEIMWYSGGEFAERYLNLDGHDVCMRRLKDEDGIDYVNTLIIDNIEYKKVMNGINITIYSNVTQTVVDCVGFDADDSFKLVR